MREREETLLEAIAGRRPNGRGHIRANCPWCVMSTGKADRKQCLTFNALTGYWKCYRCGTYGRLNDVPDDISSRIPAAKIDSEKSMNLPEGFVPLWLREGKTSMATRPALNYLRFRGVYEEVMEEARIGACIRGKFVGRIVVPIYKEGKLAGYVGRVWNSGKNVKRKYLYGEGFDRANTLYNEEALYVQTDEPVLVVEGVFDTFPFWPHAVAVLGKPSIAQVDMLLRARRPIAIVMDGDAWLEGETLARVLRLRGKQAISLKLDPGVDPDEIPDEVVEAARAAFRDVA